MKKIPERLTELLDSDSFSVLCIDDTHEVREAFKSVFLFYRPSVKFTSLNSYAEAEASIKSDQRFDLILLDHSLDKWTDTSDRDGIALATLCREHQKQAFILLTTLMSYVVEAYKESIDLYINKSNISDLFIGET